MPFEVTSMPAPAEMPLARLTAPTTIRIKPYRAAEVAELLDVHIATIYRDIEAGRLKALRVGSGKGALRIPPAAYDAYVALLEVRATAPTTVVGVA